MFLHHPTFTSTPCVTRDLSADGVSVVTAEGSQLQAGTAIKMTFAVDLGSLTRLYD